MSKTLKYGDLCCSAYYNKITKIKATSVYYYEGQSIIPHDAKTTRLIFCRHCCKSQEMTFNAQPDYYKKAGWYCDKCNAHSENYYQFTRLNKDPEYFTILEEKECVKITESKWNNKSYVHFRQDPFPHTRKWKHTAFNWGRSKKGLERSAYRSSIDQQVIVLQEDLVDENLDIYMVINIEDRRAKNRWLDHWVGDMNFSGNGRGWKNSKKKKQWMKGKNCSSPRKAKEQWLEDITPEVFDYSISYDDYYGWDEYEE